MARKQDSQTYDDADRAHWLSTRNCALPVTDFNRGIRIANMVISHSNMAYVVYYMHSI
jgi:hypothetical protein